MTGGARYASTFPHAAASWCACSRYQSNAIPSNREPLVSALPPQDDLLLEFPSEGTDSSPASPAAGIRGDDRSIFEFVVDSPGDHPPPLARPGSYPTTRRWRATRISSGAERTAVAMMTAAYGMLRQGLGASRRLLARIGTLARVQSRVVLSVIWSILQRRRMPLPGLGPVVIRDNPSIHAVKGFYRPGLAKLVVLFVSGLSLGALATRIGPAPVAGDVAAESADVDKPPNVAEGISPAAGVSRVAAASMLPGLTGSPARVKGALTTPSSPANPRPESGVAARPQPLPPQRPAAARRPGAVRAPLFRGSLSVQSRPAGASVFINGRLVGTTPLTLRDQAVGSRAVRVTMDGYESWTAATRVVASQRSVISADLRAGSVNKGGS